MSVSNKSTALTNFNPVYNPLVYVFDSTNKSQPGFRYVVDVYAAGTATKIYEGRVVPRPVDGYGYIDLSKIISNYLSHTLDTTMTSGSTAPDSFYRYDVKIGEEFQLQWAFNDSIFIAGGKTQLTQSPPVTPHTFVAGDQIIVSQTPYFTTLPGLHTVDSVVDAYNIVLNLAFQSTPTNPGTVTYADGRKTIYRDLLTYSSQVAFNGVLPFKDWPSYNSALYKLQAASDTNLLLTTMPDTFTARTTQDLFVDAAFFNSTNAIYVYFQNDAGDTFRKTTGTISYVNQYAVGPNNHGTLTLVSGTATLVKSDTLYYDFWINNDGGTRNTKKYRVYIDRRCAIEDYEILFQDRMGSFLSFAFPLRSRESAQVSRESYNSQLGDLVSTKWSYALDGAGTINTNISVDKTYEISTDTMNHEMNVLYEELISSPVALVKIDGQYYACTIQDTSVEVQSINYRKPRLRTLKFKLANQNIINI